MVDENSLAEVLSDFARTLLTDFPIQGILDHLVQRIAALLPVDAAGVTLISQSKTPHYIAASDESALLFERLQSEMSQGPCLAAFEYGRAVAVPDLRAESRFPRFSEAAVASGLGAVFTFPLRHGEDRPPLGALDLYRSTPGALDTRTMRVAQTLADVTAAYLLNAQAREEVQAVADRFRHYALHDPLTGLANRTLLQERLEHAARRAARTHTTDAVLFIDLDRFKLVNDTYGHQSGDELLVAVASRLSGLIRPGDTLARPSGDEFVFLCEDLRDAADAETLADRVTASFTEPYLIGGTRHCVTASVGIAFAGPGDAIDDQLIVRADLAMYNAKRAGGARSQVIDLRQALDSSNQVSLERDLHAALADTDPASRGLDLAYQPIVETRSEDITGVEALLRWTHPARGPIPALITVELAEHTQLINTLGAWVLRRACTDHARWLQRNPDTGPLDLAVNVSARQLASPGYLREVISTLEETGMDPFQLILEITESTAVPDNDQYLTVLTNLADTGIRIALDDFGTGYSALSYLRRLPAHIVKIDRSFTADIGRTVRGPALVHAITGLAHSLGLTVVAEGVETREQHRQIHAAGCQSAQGYLYAHPMTATALDARLNAAARPVRAADVPPPPAHDSDTPQTSRIGADDDAASGQYASTILAFTDTTPGTALTPNRAQLTRLTATIIAQPADLETPANPSRRSPTTPLTHRETQVVRSLLNGDRVPAIARELYVSNSTVRNHLASAFVKFRVSSQQELITLLRPDPGQHM